MHYSIKFFLISTFLYSAICAGQKDVTVYWDASYSSLNDDTNLKIEFLKKYLDSNTVDSVNLVVFSNSILLEEIFVKNDNSWKGLVETLSSQIMDGNTSYENLFLKKHKSENYLLFTDGKGNELKNGMLSPVNFVCSNLKECERTFSKALFPNATFVEIKPNLENTKKNDLSVKKKSINGIVLTVENAPINLIIKNISSNTQTITDLDGKFKISASKGDVLEFIENGNVITTIKVDKQTYYELTLRSLVQSLDTVELVSTNNSKEEEELVLLNNKKVEKKRIGYAVQSVNYSQITPDEATAGQALKGNFSGVQMGGSTGKANLGQVIIRGINSINLTSFPLVLLDDVPLPRSQTFDIENYDFIDPGNIESITVLKGLAATNIYGSDGNNGVIQIRSKTASFNGNNVEEKEKVLGTTKIYDNSNTVAYENDSIEYLKELAKASTIVQAYDIYLAQREIYGRSPDFFINTSSYFDGWHNDLLTKRVLSNALELSTNYSNKKAVAFKQQELGFHDDALITFSRLYDESPEKGESLRNLALAQINAGDYKDAQTSYFKFQNDLNNPIYNNINDIFGKEYKHFVNKYKNEIDTRTVSTQFMSKAVEHKRILLEWTAPSAAFNVQIVNPQQRFFTWEHTIDKEPNRIRDEKQQGYQIEEYFLTSSDKGDWVFNIEYLGGSDSRSILFKVTVFSNYGKPNESKKVETFLFSEDDRMVNRSVLKLRN